MEGKDVREVEGFKAPHEGKPFMGYMEDSPNNAGTVLMRLMEKRGLQIAVVGLHIGVRKSGNVAVYGTDETKGLYGEIIKSPEFKIIQKALYPSLLDPDQELPLKSVSWDDETKRRIEAYCFEANAGNYTMHKPTLWNKLVHGEDMKFFKEMVEKCRKRAATALGDLPKLTVGEINGLLDQKLTTALHKQNKEPK